MFATAFTLEDTLGSDEWWTTGVSCVAFFSALSAFILLTPAAVESPKWLFVVKRDSEAARHALRKLYNKTDVDDELMAIAAEGNVQHPAATSEQWSFSKLFSTKELKWPVTFVITLMLGQQFSGINVVFFFADSLYKSAGLNTQEASYAGLAVTVLNVATTILAASLIEKTGRRPILLYPMVVCCIALATQVVLVTLSTEFADEWSPDSITALSWGAIAAVAVYVVAFALGLGPIPVFMASEIFRPGPRATASAVGAITNLTATLTVALLFENVLLEYLGTYSFLPFLVSTVLFLIFFWIKLPETKNRDVDDIYRELGCYQGQNDIEMSQQNKNLYQSN